MNTKRCLYIGIDPAVSAKAVAYAALDEDLRPAALGQGDLDEVLAFVGGQQEAMVCLNGPPRPNTGLMLDPARRAALDTPPKPGRWENLRLAEYELAIRRIRVTKTPSDQAAMRAWQRQAVQLHSRLGELGYAVYPAGEGDCRQVLEAAPEVCYQLWLGHALFNRRHLEGRWQRQLVLYDLGLNIPNPMVYFEELTRYKILQGILPEEVLFEWGELQALALAYAAWLTANRREETLLVGDPEEGQVLVPVKELGARYVR